MGKMKDIHAEAGGDQELAALILAREAGTLGDKGRAILAEAGISTE